MLKILYISKATKIFSDLELTELVLRAQVFNAGHGITGMLIFENQVFTQILEGDDEAVEFLMKKISMDPRHHEIRILLRYPIRVRNYRNWMAGYRLDSRHNLVKIA